MWKQGVVAVIAIGLLVSAIGLLGSLSNQASPAHSPAAKTVESDRVHTSAAAFSQSHVAPASDAAAVQATPRGPAAAVWAVMAKPHSSVVDQREEIIAAIRASPPCSEVWCSKGRET